MIRNKKTGQMYIGQSKDIEHRFRAHRNTSEIDIDIANEGVESFDFIILEELPKDQDVLDERERYWIQYYGTSGDNEHYNKSVGGYKKRYTLWDVTACWYDSYSMKKMKTSNLCKCFRAIFNGRKVHIGAFYDFVSCQIINQIIKEETKNETLKK